MNGLGFNTINDNNSEVSMKTELFMRRRHLFMKKIIEIG